MTVPGNLSSPLLATATGAAAAAEYVIPKSLRFNSGDSALLDKTFSTAGNRKTWTWSGWVKLSKLGTTRRFWGVAGSSDTTLVDCRFETTDKLIIAVSSTQWRTTTQVFRDCSSFYHIVFAVDTTQSTANDRVKVYVNGSQITDFDVTNNPSQNSDTGISQAAVHRVGSGYITSNSFDGLMADVQFVDGVALAPTDFGETRSSDGVWVPKEFTGFGKNPNDGTTWSSSLTTNAGDNFDSSGAKTKAFDGSTSTKAYTANNSDGTTQNTSYIQLNSPKAFTGNLKVICDNGNAVYDVTGGGSTLLATNSTGSDGALIDCGTVTSADKIRVLMAGGSRPAIAAIYIDGNALLDDAVDNSFHLNFSDSSTIEALGFDSAPTTPDPDPKKGFDVVTYTGNGASTPGGSGSTQNIGGFAFEPGLLWIKDRTQSGHNHNLIDVINQPPNLLMSDSTAALTTNSTDGVTSFNPDGFTLGANSLGSQSLEMNKSGNNYVAWAWRAGGPAVPKTSGTINAEVSVSTDYGFSICKFTGTGTAGTIEHGLSTVPKWYMVKNLDTSPSEWNVYHVGTGETKRLKLNSSSAVQTAANSWNDTAPTASLFTVGTDTDVNKSGDEHIAYLWSEISGFSKFGSWTGSGSASGNKVTTGFRPRFLMWKRTDTADNWAMVDSERSPSNPRNEWLGAAYNDGESTNNSAYAVDFLDDGFELKATHAATNASGGNYIYMAFADRPGNNWDVNNIVTNEGLTTSKTQFDVVTYTGNGGTQKIGGPVYSNSLVASNGSFDSVAPASGAFNGETGTNNGDYAQASSGSNPNSLTFTPVGGIAYSTGVEVYTISSSTTVSVNGGSAQSVSASQWVSVASGSGTLTSLVVTRASTSGASLSGIRIDGTVLLDGTQPGLKFQPDFVWIKGRNAAAGHVLMDSVRGTGNKVLSSHNTAAEGSETYGQIQSFNTDGFTVEAGSTSAENSNYSNRTYVAWCWKAGGTAVSNTDGSITSSVSANAAYGFSVGTYTGTYSSQPSSLDTVGHGLNGKVPGMIISKSTNGTSNWHVWHKGLNNDEYIRLNSTNGKATLSTGAGGSIATAPTGTVFPTYYIGGSNNGSSDNLVFYCFADVPGYQRIGSYTGNGSSTGPVVVTGFKPRFLIVKRTDSTGAWVMLDSERNPANPRTKSFYADVSDAEYTPGQNWADFDESSFQLTATYGEVNASGGTYIYLAIGDDEIGSDEDCLVDVPNAVTADTADDATDTTGGYQRGNYATMNPLDNGGITLSNGNLDVTKSGSGWKSVRGTIGMSSGKWFWEYTRTSGSGNQIVIGITGAAADLSTYLDYNSDGYGYNGNSGEKVNNNAGSSYGASIAAGDVVGIAFDADAGTLEFYKNGTSQGTAFTGLTSGPYFPAISIQSGDTGSLNFGQMRFKYPIPSGYAALNTTALPAATIADGSAHFETVLWTGDNSASNRAITSSLAFSPDLVWGKERSEARSHQLYDAVRGAGSGKDLTPSGNYAEGYDSSTYGYLDSFDANGFTVAKGSNSSDGNNYWNKASQTYVAWTWNAGANSNKTYTVKVVSDSGNKYRFDDFGTSAVTLDLAEGNTYIFDQSDSSNSGHPLRFSTTSDGTHNSGTEYTTGVTTTGTPGSAGAKTTIVVGSGVATLYYYCSSHSGMGGQANTNSTAGSSNFDGSIQTTVKSNPEAGFSIIKYTGGSSAVTVGHELNATPTLFIQKNLDSTDIWRVYYTVADGSLDFMRLHTTGSKSDSSNTLPTSSVIYIGGTSGNDHILYAFTPVAGYSAFGSYTGNGSSDGPFIYTGFRPAIIIQKRTDSTGSWTLVDTARDIDNPAALELLPNSTAAEYDNTSLFDILSNGFKVRATFNNLNASGGSFIYLAFASNPFQANGGLAR